METKVVKINTAEELVLGSGSEDGVQVGDTFMVFEYGDEILDPETNRSLGKLEIVKGRVQVIHVQERLSTAKAQSYTVRRSKTVPGPLSNFGGMFGDRTVHYDVEEVEKLKIREKDEEFEEKLFVKVGDIARKLND